MPLTDTAIRAAKPSEKQPGLLTGNIATLPPEIKLKRYRSEFRKSFCEALLAKRVFLTEGKTELDVYTSVSHALSEKFPNRFKSFESLGIAAIDAGTDSQIFNLAAYFKSLGKVVFAAFDKQDSTMSAAIAGLGICHFELPEKGIEAAIINNTEEIELRNPILRFYGQALPRETAGAWLQDELYLREEQASGCRRGQAGPKTRTTSS